MTRAAWYLRRLSRMGPDEIAGRVRAAVRVQLWRRRFATSALETGPPLAQRRFRTGVKPGQLDAVSDAARSELVAAADALLAGRARFFGVERHDMRDPDWFADPKTGRRAPCEMFAFDVPYRDEETCGDIKQIWEPSRHQHLTVLAAAFAVTADERYAEMVDTQLRSWWAANPPLQGVHWISGIELGIRLLSWVWIRRLMSAWRGIGDLFEDNATALHQIWFHQRWLAALPSVGSSTNNHIVAEAAGRLAAACAFDWFPESAGWRADALATLTEQLQRNTFPSGLNRELATEYHGLVAELATAALLEATAAEVDVPAAAWTVLLRMSDALAAVVDSECRPPRQGDADDGHGLIVDGTGTDRWRSLLATGEMLFGRLEWWPAVEDGDVRTVSWAALTTPPATEAVRPAHRPAHFADAGMTVLRAPRTSEDAEIWCRLDGGPHGFLSIAAHAHADALSVEVRHGGVDVLADPGTYCYHGEPRWRSYFRSTVGHNTLELAGRDQSRSGGPFLWTRHARSRVIVAHAGASGSSRWIAEHDGYDSGPQSAVHRRTVELDGVSRHLTIVDDVAASDDVDCRLAFHLGPLVSVDLRGRSAHLTWSVSGSERIAVLELPEQLDWQCQRGRTDPPLGWYSEGFGVRTPAFTLLGTGRAGPGSGSLVSVLRMSRDSTASPYLDRSEIPCEA